MAKIVVFIALVSLLLPNLIVARDKAANEVTVTINGVSISADDPNFYSFLQMAAAQAMIATNKQADADEMQAGLQKKRSGKKSRREKNNQEDEKFIQTIAALATGIVQSAMTGNPTPAIMSTANAIVTMVKR